MTQTKNTQFKLICGLGNPIEVAPAESLHNVGFKTLDQACIFEGISFPEWQEIGNALVYTLESYNGLLYFAKPMSGDINNSGVAIRDLLQTFKLTPDELAVIHDDISLPRGKIKIASSDKSLDIMA